MSRICIDGWNLSLARGSGVATYSRNLLSALSELGHETQILLASNRGRQREDLLNLIDLVDAPAPTRRLRRLMAVRRAIPRLNPMAWPIEPSSQVIMSEIQARFPAADRLWACRDIFNSANRAHATFNRFTPLRLGSTSKTDIMHWTYPLPLYVVGTRNIYTIHDLVPLRLPYTTLDNKRNYYRLCKEMISRGDLILTDSEHSKRDIIRIFGAPESQVVNTYLAVDFPPALTAPPDEDVAALLDSALGLPWRGYFLFFGALDPKKNISRIIEAYLGSGATSPLVIVGGRAWLDEEQKDLLYEDIIGARVLKDGVLKRTDRVRQYDYMPIGLLVSLIRGARATLFPSLYEGFGLPVLESMLLGTPVLTSAEGSLPEVAGDAALTVDAYDADMIRKGIETLEADEDLRTELSRRGKVQAATFSRAAYLDRLAAAYARLGA
jgi:glycosyltransferase involved in cell wall biosynthesis